MPFETRGETQFNIGKAQAGLSREGSFGLTDEDRLRISRAAVENMIGGTVARNRAAFTEKIRPLKKHSDQSVATGNTVDFGNGNIGSVQSGSVQDSRLNNGKPTLIPFIWDGKKVSDKEAIQRSLDSGIKWPVFKTDEEATEASTRLSNSLGVDDDIGELTQIVLRAANGQPLETSVTEQKRREELMKPFLQELLTNMLNQDNSAANDSSTSPDTTEKSK